MSATKYRKKPVEIEAMLYDGTTTRCEEIHAWCGFQHDPEAGCDSGIYIETLEGRMLASVGDYIIRGVQGEFYPCKPDIFEATYEPVSADTRPAEATYCVHCAGPCEHPDAGSKS